MHAQPPLPPLTALSDAVNVRRGADSPVWLRGHDSVLATLSLPMGLWQDEQPSKSRSIRFRQRRVHNLNFPVNDAAATRIRSAGLHSKRRDDGARPRSDSAPYPPRDARGHGASRARLKGRAVLDVRATARRRTTQRLNCAVAHDTALLSRPACAARLCPPAPRRPRLRGPREGRPPTRRLAVRIAGPDLLRRKSSAAAAAQDLFCQGPGP